MRIGVADYGMNVWDGCPGGYDSVERWKRLKELGYEGIERLSVYSADEAVGKVAQMRSFGFDCATVRGPSQELSIQWTAGMGKGYIWNAGGAGDLDVFCRQANLQAEACRRWGIRTALHNHMGTAVETQEQLEYFLKQCPDVGLILDTAHLAAVGGDAVEIAGRYAARLEVIHVKDWLLADRDQPRWEDRGRFCGLDKGNIGLSNTAVLQTAVSQGYNGWVFVEHDAHLQDPYLDLAESRDVLRGAGF